MRMRNGSWIFGAIVLGSIFLLLCDKGSNPQSPVAAAPSQLTLISPNGGETFSKSDSMTIHWDMNDSVDALINQMVFDISLDSGKTYQYLGDIRRTNPLWETRSIRFSLADSTWDDKNLQWKTISPSGGCVMFIHAYGDESIGDVSNELFSIF
jgi:hypothetical protein